MDSHDDEVRNFCCLYLLLVRIGIPYLRTYFKRKWDSTAGRKRWTDCLQDGADLMRLWKPKTLAYENPKVLSGDTSKWDLSLFIKILLPRMAKKGEKKALEKLKDLRNTLCHPSDAKISNGDFERKWSDACNALTLFGAKSEDFQSIKRDAKNNLVELKPAFTKWLAQEIKLLQQGQLELLLGQEKAEKGQLVLQQEHDEIQKSQKLQHHMLCEMRNTLHTMQRHVEAISTKQLPEEGQLVLQQEHDEIRKSQKLQHQMLCEIRNTQHTIQRHVEAISTKQLPEEPREPVANELPFNFEGKMLAEYLKEYYQTGVRSILLSLPWMEGHNIKHIYTKTKIVDMDAAPEETTLEKLFTKAAKTGPNNLRRILIEGEPGIGKSSLCKKIAYDWSTKDNPELFPKVFDLVLSLKCREFHTGDDLWDAIDKQNFTDVLHEKRNDIFEYIKNNQNNVLLLLDGYDEIPGDHKDRMTESINKLISRQLLPYSYVIVTRRPGQDAKLRNHFDKKLEIKGFCLYESFSFITRFFSSAPKAAKTTISLVMKDNDVRDLVRNPLYTAILCLLLEAKKDNEELYLSQIHENILFSVTKRYCLEKLGEDVKDDDCLMAEVQDILYKLGKISFRLIKEERSDFEEKELMAIVTPSRLVAFLGFPIYKIRRCLSMERLRVNDKALMREFLVYRNTFNKLRSIPCYSLPHESLKECLATDYLQQSFAKYHFEEFKSILSFNDWVDFLRCVRFMWKMLNRCIQDKRLTWSLVEPYLSVAFLIVWHFCV